MLHNCWLRTLYSVARIQLDLLVSGPRWLVWVSCLRLFGQAHLQIALNVTFCRFTNIKCAFYFILPKALSLLIRFLLIDSSETNSKPSLLLSKSCVTVTHVSFLKYILASCSVSLIDARLGTHLKSLIISWAPSFSGFWDAVLYIV